MRPTSAFDIVSRDEWDELTCIDRLLDSCAAPGFSVSAHYGAETALSVAGERSFFRFAALLIDLGFGPEDTVGDLAAVLENAILLRESGFILHYLRAGFRDGIEFLPMTMKPALSLAASFGLADIVRALLDHGAEPDGTDDGCDMSGLSPLGTAVRDGELDCVWLLRRAGADPHRRYGGFTAVECVRNLPEDRRSLFLRVLHADDDRFGSGDA